MRERAVAPTIAGTSSTPSAGVIPKGCPRSCETPRMVSEVPSTRLLACTISGTVQE